MRKLILGMLMVAPLAFATSAQALPAGGGTSHLPLLRDALVTSQDVIAVKGGKGKGWSKGRKVGWRGGGCPPGLRKQGRC